jgi:hypothetical protein
MLYATNQLSITFRNSCPQDLFGLVNRFGPDEFRASHHLLRLIGVSGACAHSATVLNADLEVFKLVGTWSFVEKRSAVRGRQLKRRRLATRWGSSRGCAREDFEKILARLFVLKRCHWLDKRRRTQHINGLDLFFEDRELSDRKL